MCKVFFVLCAVGRRDLAAGPEKKKHTQGVFCFCSGPGERKGKEKPGWAPERGQFGCFFFLLRPRADAHSLTAGLGGDASRRGGVFFFLLRPRPDRGGVFFFFAVAPPGRSLTNCGLGRFRQGPGGVFFWLRPRRTRRANNKKCLVYYIWSKKTRRGHSKKKNTTSHKP